jgi:hypothetical protein
LIPPGRDGGGRVGGIHLSEIDDRIAPLAMTNNCCEGTVSNELNQKPKGVFTMQGKYEALALYLKERPKSVTAVTIPFSELDKMLNSPLPESAYTHRPWWANQKNTTNRPQAKAWISAGFEVETVNQFKLNGSVRFIRSNQKQIK